MEWNERLQNIIDYVEHHLQKDEEAINADEVAKLAGCSFDFFQKVFSYMNGISFADYVRARKLTLAGYDIKSTSLKIIDISYKYGYNSPTSFTKAFRQFHGVSPKEARKHHVALFVTPKMQIMKKQHYTFRLVKKPSMRLIGKRIKVSKVNQAQYARIPEFWSECHKDGTFAQLVSLDQGTPKGRFGLFSNEQKYENAMDYSIMVICDEELPDGYSAIILPETTWAIFDCFGVIPESIHSCWKYLSEEWLVTYPFKHADCPELEWYSDGNPYDSTYLSQIWIPVIDEFE